MGDGQADGTSNRRHRTTCRCGIVGGSDNAAMNRVSQPVIALAGSGGSHPATIRAVAAALAVANSSSRQLILDLSRLDTRGGADYTGMQGTVRAITPQSLGLRSVFPTAAANLMVSGGTRRFERMVDHFAMLLHREDVDALLLCHNHGFPEQALIKACEKTGTGLAQIDEGPFSGMVTGSAPGVRRSRLEQLLVGARALPARDQSGRSHDLFFPTAPVRARRLIARGIDPARIVTVAAPRFDTLPALAARWRERVPASDGTARVLIVHQPFGRDGKVDTTATAAAEATLMAGVVLAAQLRPLAVTLRAHPRSNTVEIERLAGLLAPIAGTGSVSTGTPLYDQIAVHDVAVGFYSSALLEAAACGMPTASVTIPIAAFVRRGEGEKAAAIARFGVPSTEDAAELCRIIVGGIDNRQALPGARLFDEALGMLDGGSSARVAHAMLDLARAARGRHAAESPPVSHPT